jgi:hypothetical protein
LFGDKFNFGFHLPLLQSAIPANETESRPAPASGRGNSRTLPGRPDRRIEFFAAIACTFGRAKWPTPIGRPTPQNGHKIRVNCPSSPILGMSGACGRARIHMHRR